MPAGGARILLVVVVDYSRLMVDAGNQDAITTNLVPLHLQSAVAAGLGFPHKLNELVVSDLRHLFSLFLSLV